MKQLLLSLALAATLPGLAQAACFAEYKAKQDAPLRLHYGIVQLDGDACPDTRNAEAQVADRLSGSGWQLLTVQSLSETPPTEKQRKEAGDFFLRY